MNDARERMALGLFLLVILVIGALVAWPELANVKLFELLAQGIVMQGFLQLVGAYYFTASKSGVELAERNAGIVEASATASNVLAANPDPQAVTVVNAPDEPVPTTDTPDAAAVAQQFKDNANA